MTATSSALSLCLFAAALGPCSEPPPPSAEVATEAQPLAPNAPPPGAQRPRELPQQQTQTAQAFMREHAKEAEELRRGVIAGRFDLIHRVSAVMASDAWSSNLRSDYLPHVTAVRRAASAALEARSMPAAGAALGELGVACAACHREHGGPREPENVEPLADGVGTMALHAAAEQALWQGLYTPSEASWKRGAQRLAEAPELASDVEDVDALGRHLRDLAREAAGGAARPELYGSIMATCSTCHRRLSVEPR
jgi:cytochrome c556